jgi:hypothetical protein
LVESQQPRRKLFAIIALVMLSVGGFIILRPRLWVKNKTAKVIVDGRLSEDVKLFHGSDDRLLFYLKDDPRHTYFFSKGSGVLKCSASEFASLKIIVYSPHVHPQCETAAATAIVNQQSLEFTRDGHATVVSWQAAPR